MGGFLFIDSRLLFIFELECYNNNVCDHGISMFKSKQIHTHMAEPPKQNF